MSQPPLASASRAASSLFSDIGGDIDVSFEFFPPKTDAMQQTLWQSIETLAPLNPRFVSVTYGAGGTTRERTHATVARIASDTNIPAAAHLTCVDASKAEIEEVARAYWDAGVRHIVALRGDPPVAGQSFTPHPDGYASAAELVEGLHKIAPFEISVSAYPETHPEAISAESDLENLKRKLDAGATRAITQFFFEADTYFRFRDRAAAAGIDAEIVPGIMPVTSFAGIRKMSAMCGTDVPVWLSNIFDGLEDLPNARQLVAATTAAELSSHLYQGGVRQFHFYTLNRSELSFAVCHMLGLRPQIAAAGE